MSNSKLKGYSNQNDISVKSNKEEIRGESFLNLKITVTKAADIC